MFAGNFAPQGWAFCDGQLLAVSQNDALFSLFGTTYGGDGRTTFGLPDLRGRVPIHAGTGPGLSNRRLGSKAGTESVTLTGSQIPSHAHTVRGTGNTAATGNPADQVPAQSTTVSLYAPTAPTVDMNPAAVVATGGSRSHSNLMPTLCIHFIVALVGIYPSRQ